MLASARYKTFNFVWIAGDGKGCSGGKTAIKKSENRKRQAEYPAVNQRAPGYLAGRALA